MLRKALLLISLALVALGLGIWLGGAPSGLPMVIWGGVLLAALLVERWRYHPADRAQSAAWQETSERFIDPESGREMRVFYNPSTGERRYEWAQPEDRGG